MVDDDAPDDDDTNVDEVEAAAVEAVDDASMFMVMAEGSPAEPAAAAVTALGV